MTSSCKKVAVIGSGIAGLSAAWLLSRTHDVVLFERDQRLGGHANTVRATVDGATTHVDTGFIVYNERNYPNLVALLDHLGVATHDSDMSFAVSARDARLEYSSIVPIGLFGQVTNICRPAFWRMLSEIRRFYEEAPSDLRAGRLGDLTLGQYLDAGGYSATFINDHLLPMGAAIWSASTEEMRLYPAAAFVRFFESHGLLLLTDRPRWRTVTGGSQSYVRRLAEGFAGEIRPGAGPSQIVRRPDGVHVVDTGGHGERFDDVVIATHADQALGLLGEGASEREHHLLGAIRYARNDTWLHTDRRLMPRRRAVWASWNYVSRASDERGMPEVTYWLNRLQGLKTPRPLFVTLNPHRAPNEDEVIDRFVYDHPVFDTAAIAAQQHLWDLQGKGGVWFCGSYFGYGFHEDALQAGLAVAEAIGGVRRPWTVPDESGRVLGLKVGSPAAAPDLPEKVAA